LLIPFFRLYVEGVFFVDGKCGGGGGGLRTERRVGISGSFFYVCERAWTYRIGGGLFFGDLYGGEKSCFVM